MKKFVSLMAAVGMVVLSASPLYAKPIKCPKGDLQRAIDKAEIGAELKIRGTCEGPFFINKDLKLIGPATLSASAGGFSVLIIRGGTVTLRNLTIDADGSNNGIFVEGSSIEVDGVVVEDASAEGLRVDGSSFAIVTNSEFNNDDAGVVITGSSNAFLFQNNIQNNSSRGIVVNINSSATVQDNDIEANLVGLLVTKMSSVVLLENRILDNTDIGVWVADQYGYLSTASPPNIIQSTTGTDVVCEARGIFEANEVQTSSSNTTSLAGCTVLGTIF